MSDACYKSHMRMHRSSMLTRQIDVQQYVHLQASRLNETVHPPN